MTINNIMYRYCDGDHNDMICIDGAVESQGSWVLALGMQFPRPVPGLRFTLELETRARPNDHVHFIFRALVVGFIKVVTGQPVSGFACCYSMIE